MASSLQTKTPWTATCNRLHRHFYRLSVTLSLLIILNLQLKQVDSPVPLFSVSKVANLNGRDNTFTLKDFLYKEIQKDWPGYTEGDQQLLKRILFRYVARQPAQIVTLITSAWCAFLVVVSLSVHVFAEHWWCWWSFKGSSFCSVCWKSLSWWNMLLEVSQLMKSRS